MRHWLDTVGLRSPGAPAPAPMTLHPAREPLPVAVVAVAVAPDGTPSVRVPVYGSVR